MRFRIEWEEDCNVEISAESEEEAKELWEEGQYPAEDVFRESIFDPDIISLRPKAE